MMKFLRRIFLFSKNIKRSRHHPRTSIIGSQRVEDVKGASKLRMEMTDGNSTKDEQQLLQDDSQNFLANFLIALFFLILCLVNEFSTFSFDSSFFEGMKVFVPFCVNN